MQTRSSTENGKEWLEVYKIAVDECRFNIRLGWDRAQYFLTLNVAIITAGIGILKFGLPDAWLGLAGSLFLVGFLIALLGVHSISRTHLYYQRSRDRMLAIESRLGWREGAAADVPWYDPRASRTTDVMREPQKPGSLRYRLPRIGTIRPGTFVYNTIVVLLLLAFFDVVASCFLFARVALPRTTQTQRGAGPEVHGPNTPGAGEEKEAHLEKVPTE